LTAPSPFALANLSKTAHEHMGVLCGVDHRRDKRRRAILHLFQEVRMSDTESERQRELECLRLASELTQLATETVNPDLKAHCVRLARIWTQQAEQGPNSNIPL
jgi:hypothetical protein